MNHVVLGKNGNLYKFIWNEKTEIHEKVDVTKNAVKYLFRTCELEEGVTLRDVFLLLKKDLKNYDLFFGLWCKEIVNEGLKEPKKTRATERVKQRDLEDDDTEISFLELYWGLYPSEVPNECPVVDGFNIPSFHGIGYAKANNAYGLKEGDSINYGIDFSSPAKLAHLPLVLKKKIQVFNDFKSQFKSDEFQIDYSLVNILYGILYELSYYGSPKERKKQSELLMSAIDEVDFDDTI